MVALVILVSYVRGVGGAVGVVMSGGTGARTDLEAADVLHLTPTFLVLIETLRDGLHIVAVQQTHIHKKIKVNIIISMPYHTHRHYYRFMVIQCCAIKS